VLSETITRFTDKLIPVSENNCTFMMSDKMEKGGDISSDTEEDPNIFPDIFPGTLDWVQECKNLVPRYWEEKAKNHQKPCSPPREDKNHFEQETTESPEESIDDSEEQQQHYEQLEGCTFDQWTGLGRCTCEEFEDKVTGKVQIIICINCSKD